MRICTLVLILSSVIGPLQLRCRLCRAEQIEAMLVQLAYFLGMARYGRKIPVLGVEGTGGGLASGKDTLDCRWPPTSITHLQKSLTVTIGPMHPLKTLK